MQEKVRSLFTAEAGYWENVYRQPQSLASLIYRQRKAIALAWTDELALPAGARALDLGCGAGLTSVALARRGLHVSAVDFTDAMIQLTQARVVGANVANRVFAEVCDAHALSFADRTFALVIALGLVPWLHTVPLALREIVRVLQPGGYLILTADNRARLDYFLDPLHNIELRPVKRRLRSLMEQRGLWRRPQSIRMNLYSRDELLQLLRDVRVEPLHTAALGFGPFTWMGRSVLPQLAGIRLHQLLQGLAERGTPGLRATSGQYMVLSRKLPDLTRDSGQPD